MSNSDSQPGPPKQPTYKKYNSILAFINTYFHLFLLILFARRAFSQRTATRGQYNEKFSPQKSPCKADCKMVNCLRYMCGKRQPTQNYNPPIIGGSSPPVVGEYPHEKAIIMYSMLCFACFTSPLQPDTSCPRTKKEETIALFRDRKAIARCLCRKLQ